MTDVILISEKNYIHQWSNDGLMRHNGKLTEYTHIGIISALIWHNILKITWRLFYWWLKPWF